MMFEVGQLLVVCALSALAWLAARLLPGLPAAPAHRRTELDGLRGVAAVGVVACHVSQHLWAFAGVTAEPLIADHVAILGVQMFFALTGFLFTDRVLDRRFEPTGFFLGRIRRIVPMYLVAVLGTLATALLLGDPSGQPAAQSVAEAMDVLKFGFTALTTDPKLPLFGLNALALIGTAWTLSYEWAFYLLLIPAAAICTSQRRAALVLAAGAALAWGDFHTRSEMVVWPFFLPGVFAALAIRHLPALAPRLRLGLSWAALPIIGLVLWLPAFWTGPKLLLAAALFLLILVSRPRVLLHPAVQTLGRISYSLYLLQYLVIFPITRLIFGNPDLLGGLAARLLCCAAMMVLAVLAAWAGHRLVEQPAGTAFPAARKNPKAFSP